MIENDTNYALLFKGQNQYSFEQTRKFAHSFVMDLPHDVQDEIYDELNRGVDLLSTEPQMLMYLYSFGKMHEAKLLYAFENMDKSIWKSDKIAVVDYGCGQGLATMVLADFMRKNDIDSSKINRVTLIEPSEKCLKRAALHTSCFMQGAEIRCVNKFINDLCDEDIKNEEPIPTIHLFSNIIDIVEVDLDKLSSLLTKCRNDYDQYICVGLLLNVERLDSFADLMGLCLCFTQDFDSGEFKDGKSWTCVVRICVNNSQEISRLSYDIDELDYLITKDPHYDAQTVIYSEQPQSEIIYKYSKIRIIIDEFANKQSGIACSDKLILDCSKYLLSVKEKIGSNNDIYIKLSTIIAHFALQGITEELNHILEDDPLAINHRNNTRLALAWCVIKNINVMDIESEFRNKTYTSYVDTISKIKYKHPRIATIDLRTEREYYDSCKSLGDYERYLSKYANGKYRREASDHYNTLKTRRDQILKELKEKELKMFNACKRVDDYKNYLSKHPNGIYAKKAKEKITELERLKAILVILAITIVIVLLIVTNSFMPLIRILIFAFIILSIVGVFMGFFNGGHKEEFENNPLGCINAIIIAIIAIWYFITDVLE